MRSVWGWNPATLWAVGIAVLAVAAVIVVARDGVDRRNTREKFANLVRVEREPAVGAVALVLTNLAEQPVFLRSVLLWVDLRVQARDLLVDRSLVTTRWPWLIGRVQVRCEYHAPSANEDAGKNTDADGYEIAPKQSRRVVVALSASEHVDRVLQSAVAFVDSEGRTFTRRSDGRVLSGERISRRLRSRSRLGDPIT